MPEVTDENVVNESPEDAPEASDGVTSDEVQAKRARNQELREAIAAAKAAQSDAARSAENEIKGSRLDREAASMEAELARLTAPAPVEAPVVVDEAPAEAPVPADAPDAMRTVIDEAPAPDAPAEDTKPAKAKGGLLGNRQAPTPSSTTDQEN